MRKLSSLIVKRSTILASKKPRPAMWAILEKAGFGSRPTTRRNSSMLSTPISSNTTLDGDFGEIRPGLGIKPYAVLAEPAQLRRLVRHHSCGVSVEDHLTHDDSFIQSVYRFHVYYQIRRYTGRYTGPTTLR